MSYADIAVDDCGRGYDSLKGALRERIVPASQCHTKGVDQSHHIVTRIIKNYDDLFKLLEIQYDESFFQKRLVRKILDNWHINPYTITIAQYEEKTLFETIIPGRAPYIAKDMNISTFYHRYGDAMVSAVETGGRHLILWHIETPSEKIYRRLEAQLSHVKLEKKLADRLRKIEKKYPIIVKEYFSRFLQGIPTDDLNTSLDRSDYFQTLLSSSARPYRYTLKPFMEISRKLNISQTKERVYVNIQNFLIDAYARNAYTYYRHHESDFFPLDNQTKKALRNYVKGISNSMKQHNQKKMTLLEQKSGDTILKMLPKRFRAAIPKQNKLSIPYQQITFDIPNFASKIQPHQTMKISLSSQLDLQHRGKIMRLSHLIEINYGDQTFKKRNKKILYDTYINFPGLVFAKISQNYGICSQKICFDKYIKTFTLHCSGIIKEAHCHYSLQIDKTLTLTCDQVKYRPFKTEFQHAEAIEEQ